MELRCGWVDGGDGGPTSAVAGCAQTSNT